MPGGASFEYRGGIRISGVREPRIRKSFANVDLRTVICSGNVDSQRSDYTV